MIIRTTKLIKCLTIYKSLFTNENTATLPVMNKDYPSYRFAVESIFKHAKSAKTNLKNQLVIVDKNTLQEIIIDEKFCNDNPKYLNSALFLYNKLNDILYELKDKNLPLYKVVQILDYHPVQLGNYMIFFDWDNYINSVISNLTNLLQEYKRKEVLC